MSRPRYRFRFMMSSAGRGETKNKEKSHVIQPSGGRTGRGDGQKNGGGYPSTNTKGTSRVFFIPIGSFKRFKSLWCGLFRFEAIAEKKQFYMKHQKNQPTVGVFFFSSGRGPSTHPYVKNTINAFFFIFTEKIFFPRINRG